ncbi:HNH endonuclease [Methylobacterium sp. E-066]|uniref:HNH endonuclease n=1 Tax=Methylobacterium sp. E-066 TaxID=2836584 RepID=UPI001FB9A822|nr:HNH endonuclease [Methylobacterium sp. E-066]MCJ2140054.1 HNH endonuclease [Methylobacterium sp. E-066]
MPRCIFCDAELRQDTKPEHILLDSFGGRKTTRKVVCSICNETFGKTIDDELAKQTLHIRNMFQLRSGSGGEAPMLRRVEVGQDKIDIKGDGTMRRVAKPFKVTYPSADKVEVQFTTNELEEIFRHIPDVAAILKLPEEQVREQIFRSTAHSIEQRPDFANFTYLFGGPDAIRSMAKAALTLWATHVGNNEVRGEPYAATRVFVLRGSADFTFTRSELDSRAMYDAAEITRRYGPIFNAIYVASDANGRVVAHYTLNNVIGFRIVLAEDGGVPSRQVGLISNPLDPAVWTDQAASEIPIPFAWLDAPDYPDDLHMARERIVALHRLYQSLMTPRVIGRISDEVFAKHGFTNGDDSVPQGALERIIREISGRLAKHQLSLPHEETISEEEIRALWAAWAAKRKR